MSHGQASILLTADDTRLRPQLEQATSTIKAFAISASTMLKGLAIGAVTAAFFNLFNVIKEGVRTAIAEFEAQEIAEKKLNNVIRSTGGAAGWSAEQLLAMANSLAQITIYGDDAIITAQAVLATFTNVRGNVFEDALKAAMDMSALLEGDLQGSIIQVGKALQDPVKGITALSRVGVNFSESQKKLIEQLVEAGRVEEAQRIILKELQTEFGGASDATDTWTDRTTQLGKRVGELYEAGGKLIVTLFEPFLRYIEAGVGALETLAPAIQFVAEGVADLLEVGLEFVDGFLLGMLGPIGVVIQGFMDFIGAGATAGENLKFLAVTARLAMEEFSTIIHLKATDAAYGLVVFANQLIHFNGVVLPTIIGNVLLTLKSMFEQADEMFITAAKNLGKNAAAIAKTIKDAFKGEFHKPEMVNILDGFELNYKWQDPKAREEGEIEKGLRTKREELQKQIDETRERLEKEYDDATGAKEKGKPNYKPPTIETDPDKKKKEKKAKTEDVGGAGEGLLALYDRIQRNAATIELKDATKELTEAVKENTEAVRGGGIGSATPYQDFYKGLGGGDNQDLVLALHDNGKMIKGAVDNLALHQKVSP